MNLKDIFDIIFSRKIIIFGGEFGRGKTLSMCAYTYFASIINNKNIIISNIPLKLGKADKINTYKPLIETKQFDEENKNSIFFMDEMQNDLDSRDFMNPKNRYLMNWVKGLRKDNSQVVGSIQYFDFLEKRLSDLLQLIIIPSWVKFYSNNEEIDNKIRMGKKDFRSRWYILDKKVAGEYIIPSINLFPFLNFYQTNFKPNALIINHKEYMQNLKDKKSRIKYENYEYDLKDRLKFNIDNWNENYKKLIGR